MVCYVYSGIQGDVGLPGPSGTPGDGSLRSEKTLTIYKGDKVTQQGKDRNERCSTLTLHRHTHTHTGSNRVVRVRMWRALSTNNVPNVTRKRSSDCSKPCSSGGNIGGRRRGWSQSHLVEIWSEWSDSLPHSCWRPASSPSLLSSGCAQQHRPQCVHPPPPSSRVFMAVFIHLLVLPVITTTTLNSCVSLGYAVQGEVGLPGDPGQPMVNGAVEFLGFPKGHKGTQVCRCSVKTNRNPISSQSANPPPPLLAQPHHSFLKQFRCSPLVKVFNSNSAGVFLRDLCLTFSGQTRTPGTTRKDISILGSCLVVCAWFHFFSGKGQPGPKGLRGFPGLPGRPVGFSFFNKT